MELAAAKAPNRETPREGIVDGSVARDAIRPRELGLAIDAVRGGPTAAKVVVVNAQNGVIYLVEAEPSRGLRLLSAYADAPVEGHPEFLPIAHRLKPADH